MAGGDVIGYNTSRRRIKRTKERPVRHTASVWTVLKSLWPLARLGTTVRIDTRSAGPTTMRNPFGWVKWILVWICGQISCFVDWGHWPSLSRQPEIPPINWITIKSLFSPKRFVFCFFFCYYPKDSVGPTISLFRTRVDELFGLTEQAPDRSVQQGDPGGTDVSLDWAHFWSTRRGNSVWTCSSKKSVSARTQTGIRSDQSFSCASTERGQNGK